MHYLPKLLKVEVNENSFASDQTILKAFDKSSYALMESPSSYFKFNSFSLQEKKPCQFSHSSLSSYVSIDDLSLRTNKELPHMCNNYLHSNEYSNQTFFLNVMILMAKKNYEEYQFISYMQGYMAHHQLTRDSLVRELTELEPSVKNFNQIMKSRCFLLAMDVPSLIGNNKTSKKWTFDPTLNWSEIFVMISLFLESCKKTASKMQEDTSVQLKSKDHYQSVCVDKCLVVNSNQISYHTTSPVLSTSLVSSKKYFSTSNNSTECIVNQLVSKKNFNKKTFCNSPVICDQVPPQKESVDFEIYSQNPTQNQFQNFVKTSIQLNEKKKQDKSIFEKISLVSDTELVESEHESFLARISKNRKIPATDSNFDCSLTKVSSEKVQMIKSRQNWKVVAKDITTGDFTSYLITPDTHCVKIPCVEFSDDVVLHPCSSASNLSPSLHLSPSFHLGKSSINQSENIPPYLTLAHAKKTIGPLDQQTISDNQKDFLDVVQSYSPSTCCEKTNNIVDTLRTENNISTLDILDEKSESDIYKDFQDAIQEFTLFCYKNSKRNKTNLKRNKTNLTDNYLEKNSSSHSKRFKADQLPDIGTKRVKHSKISEILKQDICKPDEKLTVTPRPRNKHTQSLSLIASSNQSHSQIFRKSNRGDLCFSPLILSNTKQNKKMNPIGSCVGAELFTLDFTCNQSSTVESILGLNEKSFLQYNPDIPDPCCFKNCFESLSPPCSPILLQNFLSNEGSGSSSSVQIRSKSFSEKKFSKIGKVIQNVKPVLKSYQQVMPVCPDKASNLIYYINYKKNFQKDKPNRLVKYLDFDFIQHLKNERIIEITDILEHRGRICNQLFKMYPSLNLQDSKIALQNSHLLESYNYRFYQHSLIHNNHASTLAVTKTIMIPLNSPIVSSESISSMNSDVACNSSLMEEEKKGNGLNCAKTTLCSKSGFSSTECCSSVLCGVVNSNIQRQQNLTSHSVTNILGNLNVDKTKEICLKAPTFDCSIEVLKNSQKHINFKLERNKRTRQLKDKKSYSADNSMLSPVRVIDSSLLDTTSNSLKSLTDEGSPTSARTAMDNVLSSKPSHECLEKESDKTRTVCLVIDNLLFKKPKLECLEQTSAKTPVFSNINTVVSLKPAQKCLQKISGNQLAPVCSPTPKCFEKMSLITHKGGLKRKKTDLNCDQKIAKKKKKYAPNFKVPVEPHSTSPIISNTYGNTEACKLLTGLDQPFTTGYKLNNAIKSEHNNEVFNNFTSATCCSMQKKFDGNVCNFDVPFQNVKSPRKRSLVNSKLAVSPKKVLKNSKKVKKSFEAKEKSKFSQIQENLKSARRSQRSVTTDTIMRIKECHKKEESNEEDIPYQNFVSDSSGLSMHSKISLLNSSNKYCSLVKNTSISLPMKNHKNYDIMQQGIAKVVLTDCNNPNRNQNFTNQNRKLPSDSYVTDDRTHKEKTTVIRKNKQKYWYPDDTNKVNQKTVGKKISFFWYS